MRTDDKGNGTLWANPEWAGLGKKVYQGAGSEREAAGNLGPEGQIAGNLGSKGEAAGNLGPGELNPGKAAPGRTEPAQVAVIQKMAEILDLLAQETGAGVSQISERLQMPRTTVHRILQTLTACGIVTSGRSPGPRLIGWAHAALREMDLREAGLPILEGLVRNYRETASIYVRVGSARICVERLEGGGLLQHSIRIGEPMPLHVGSAGRILLAWLAPEERERLWKDSEAQFGRPATETGAVADEAGLDEAGLGTAGLDEAGLGAAGEPRSADWPSILRDGWTASMGERDSALSSLSVPIFGKNGRVVGALSLSGPGDRLSADRMKAALPELMEGAAAIRRRMDGLPVPDRRALGSQGPGSASADR